MSDGSLNFPVRATPPDAPSVGRYKLWVSSLDGLPKITHSNGTTIGFENVYGSNFEFSNDEYEDTNTTIKNSY